MKKETKNLGRIFFYAVAIVATLSLSFWAVNNCFPNFTAGLMAVLEFLGIVSLCTLGVGVPIFCSKRNSKK